MRAAASQTTCSPPSKPNDLTKSWRRGRFLKSEPGPAEREAVGPLRGDRRQERPEHAVVVAAPEQPGEAGVDGLALLGGEQADRQVDGRLEPVELQQHLGRREPAVLAVAQQAEAGAGRPALAHQAGHAGAHRHVEEGAVGVVGGVGAQLEPEAVGGPLGVEAAAHPRRPLQHQHPLAVLRRLPGQRQAGGTPLALLARRATPAPAPPDAATDHHHVAARMAAAGLDLEQYGWYLDLRRFGSVPHAGVRARF